MGCASDFALARPISIVARCWADARSQMEVSPGPLSLDGWIGGTDCAAQADGGELTIAGMSGIIDGSAGQVPEWLKGPVC